MLSSPFELLELHFHIEAFVLLSSQLIVYTLHRFTIGNPFSLKLLNFTNQILNFLFSFGYFLFDLTIEFDRLLDFFLFYNNLLIQNLNVRADFVALLS